MHRTTLMHENSGSNCVHVNEKRKASEHDIDRHLHIDMIMALVNAVVRYTVLKKRVRASVKPDPIVCKLLDFPGLNVDSFLTLTLGQSLARSANS